LVASGLEFIFACIRPGVYLWLHQVWSLSLLASGLEFIFGCIRPGVYLCLHQAWNLSLVASGLEFIFAYIIYILGIFLIGSYMKKHPIEYTIYKP
jgi:hypothetical protein